MHYFRFLMVLSLFTLLNMASCEECDFYYLSGIGPELIVDRDHEAATINVGDTIWISAEFSAVQEREDVVYEITDGGGLIVTQVFSARPGSDTLTAGLDDFTVLEEVGTVQPTTVSTDPAASVLRFTCGEGICRFRQGFRADVAGTYLFRPRGSAIDVINTSLRPCGDAAFGSTVVTGERNLGGFADAPFLIYSDPAASSRFFSEERANMFAITVQ